MQRECRCRHADYQGKCATGELLTITAMANANEGRIPARTVTNPAAKTASDDPGIDSLARFYGITLPCRMRSPQYI
jgi:hypothetical protein